MLVQKITSRARWLAHRLMGRHIPTPVEVEKEEWSFYVKYLQPGMVVFDVGANVGELASLFSRFVGPDGQVHAFEASSETYDRLKTIVTLGRRKNIVLNPMALTDRPGTVRLNVYDTDHSGWTTLADRPLQNYGVDVRPVRTEEVTATSIDDYCATRGIERIDLLKIDVEGAEMQVLAGAERMLKERRIACCVFEFGQTTFDMGNSPRELAALVARAGYRLRNLNKGTSLFPGGESAATAQFSMCICTPQ